MLIGWLAIVNAAPTFVVGPLAICSNMLLEHILSGWFVSIRGIGGKFLRTQMCFWFPELPNVVHSTPLNRKRFTSKLFFVQPELVCTVSWTREN